MSKQLPARITKQQHLALCALKDKGAPLTLQEIRALIAPEYHQNIIRNLKAIGAKGWIRISGSNTIDKYVLAPVGMEILKKLESGILHIYTPKSRFKEEKIKKAKKPKKAPPPKPQTSSAVDAAADHLANVFEQFESNRNLLLSIHKQITDQLKLTEGN